MTDDQIDSFLRKNRPVAPAIDEAKALGNVLARVGLAPMKRRVKPFAWMAFSGALAAGLAALFIVSKPAFQTPVTTPIEVVDEEWREDELFDEGLPSLVVGEDYLDLLAKNETGNEMTSGRVTK
ncbi:MAG: hypothetical protein AAB250_04800 [Bdellovibrionota bacterium]